MDFKIVGSVLLVVGTSIGAGMLALPIATAELGFLGSLALLFGCWFVMTMGALLILEVNMWMPQNSNLISMAKATIGPIGQLIATISYLLLLYSLISAYIAGGSDLFHHLLLARHLDISPWLSALLFTGLFGGIVFLGIRAVDYVNRGLMFIKLGAYVLLVLLLMPYVSFDYLMRTEMQRLSFATAVMVTITSFGYATIIPSLRIYFAGDVVKLKKAIMIGSLIPLVCYIFWDAAIMGVIPLDGDHGLLSILQSKNSTSDLMNRLTSVASSQTIHLFVKLFTSICVLTSFLGVSLCLTDFLADGLHQEKAGMSNILIHLLTFVPPFVLVLFFPGVFISALEYAGILCVILLLWLPAWMAWAGRYHKHFSGPFKVFGGKGLLAVILILASVLIIRGFFG